MYSFYWSISGKKLIGLTEIFILSIYKKGTQINSRNKEKYQPMNDQFSRDFVNNWNNEDEGMTQ